MADQRVPAQTRSLGELVAALGPGDDCPWCGAVLEQGSFVRALDGGRDPGFGDDSVEVLLLCPTCGSEVCAAGTSGETPRRASLRAAA